MPTRDTIHVNHTHQIYDSFKQEFPVISDQTILGDILIDQERYACLGLKFTNCEFKGEVKFDSVNIKFGVRFIDCVFEKNCVFIKLYQKDIKEGFNDDNNGIYFKNSTNNKAIIIHNSKIERAVRFDNQESLKDLSLANVEAHGVDIIESKIGGLDIDSLETKIGFRIEKSEVSGQGRYFGCSGGGITFMSTKFERDQYLRTNSVQSIVTNDGVFQDELIIKACPADNYTFYGTDFKKGVNITAVDGNNPVTILKSFYIKNCNFQGGLSFIGNKGKAMLLSNLEKLTIICSNLLLGNITFEHTDIYELSISGTNTAASISFRNGAFKTVRLDYLINQGKLYFADIECLDRNGSSLSIAKTSLGSAILLNVNLLHFESVIIKHSHLTDMIFTDVKWFNLNQLNPRATFTDEINVDLIYHFKKKKSDFRGWALIKTNKEVYRQLKYTALKLGDSVQSLVFQGQEMKLYKDELDFYRWDRLSTGNKAMMWLNQSNDYGNAWLKPVLILLALNLGFYGVITILQSGEYYLLPSCNKVDIVRTWQLLSTHFDAYWYLLNPIRKLNDLYADKKVFSSWTVFWDYFDRIIVSYFIFQVVSAFRKYTKGG